MRGDEEATDIAELLTINEGDDIEWNESTEYRIPYFVAGKSSEDVFRITADRLRECRIAPNRIATTLRDIEKQLDEIAIFIEYEDVFGTKFNLADNVD